MTHRITFLVLVLFAVMPLEAQQDGSVAIAHQISNATDGLMSSFDSCVARRVGFYPKNLSQKEMDRVVDKANQSCLKALGRVTKSISDVSDDASGAADAARPIILQSQYGGWGGSTTVVVPNTSSSYPLPPPSDYREGRQNRRVEPDWQVARRERTLADCKANPQNYVGHPCRSGR